ncbi:MAG: hypothetical protein ABEH38_02025 [Flavobacteriales bacterium]
MRYKVLVSSLIFLHIALFHTVSGQSGDEEKYDKRISVGEMLKEMANKENEPYRLKNSKIYVKDYDAGKFDSLSVDVPVQLSNCKYETTVLLVYKNIVFNERFDLYEVKNFGGFFDSCVFKEGFSVRFSKIPNLGFINSKLNNQFAWFDTKGNLFLRDSKFRYKPDSGEMNNTAEIAVFKPWNKTLKELRISNCEFGSTARTSLLRFDNNFNKIQMIGNEFDCMVDFSNSFIRNSFIASNNKFKKSVGMFDVRLPPNTTSFDFDQIKGHKLGVFDFLANDEESLQNKYENVYKAKGDSQLTDTIPNNKAYFNLLFGAYNQIYKCNKARGNRKSANACYIEKKEIETRKLRYEYEQNPTLRNFINYNLNRFLWVFARYGTSPTQAIVISFYIILLFSAFYFFTHTKWDRIDRAFLLDRLRILSEYFRSEKSLEELYGEQEEGEADEIDPFVREMEANRQEVPRFIRILGKGLFFFTLIPRRIGKWFIRRTDFLKGRWKDLSPGRKWIVGTGAFFFSLFYGVYLILLRGLNSFVLSLNSFVTLGFGVIPVSGVARYLTILEGFIGWFLLSIFSISLINQILQF